MILPIAHYRVFSEMPKSLRDEIGQYPFTSFFELMDICGLIHSLTSLIYLKRR